ncbi:MAG: hypothetical protein ACLGJB_24255 [Blastocatellia bacterium]
MNRRWVLLLLVLAALIALAAPDSAHAQCAMCKATVENSADAAAASRGLNLASLVLLVPPVTIFAGLFGLFYRYRNVQGRREMPPYES